MINNKTSIPLGYLTIKVSQDIPASRFVNYSGGLASPGDKILGVSTRSWKSGDIAAICFQGIVTVEAATVIPSPGTEIGPTTAGKATAFDKQGQSIINIDAAYNNDTTIRVKL